jgi:hypothetical protein
MRAPSVNDARRSATGGGAIRPMTRNPFIGTLVYILLFSLATIWRPPTSLLAQGASTPTPTVSTPRPGIAHLAILVSESVVPVGGSASSEVFVHLENVRPGIKRLQIMLRFDPQVLQAQDADGDAANGTQVAIAAFFEGAQATGENRADNTGGVIVLDLGQTEGPPVEGTAAWRKVATVAWTGQQAGNSAITIDAQSRFIDADGQAHAPSAMHHGTAFVRQPGQVSGRVKLQGRAEHGNTLISSSLAATRVDRTYTLQDGSFVLTVSHGEGFYTLSASAPGYLTAQGSRPIKLTVGSEVNLGEITLVGGDVNQDNKIDIRDLSYVAYHLDQTDAQSDINGDGRVDILDLTLIAGNFGTIGPTTWPISG